MEKMEVSKDIVEKEIMKEITPKAEKVNPKGTKWIKNLIDGTKKCESCGAVMRGWAYREPFAYCPKCGAMAEEEG